MTIFSVGVGGEGRGDIFVNHACLEIQEQYTLEQYYYIPLYRQQILTVWFGRE